MNDEQLQRMTQEVDQLASELKANKAAVAKKRAAIERMRPGRDRFALKVELNNTENEIRKAERRIFEFRVASSKVKTAAAKKRDQKTVEFMIRAGISRDRAVRALADRRVNKAADRG